MTDTKYVELRRNLEAMPRRWLVTGAAGFIGSNLCETLLRLNQIVVGLDNFSTGHQRNIDGVLAGVTPEQRLNFNFIEGDIRSLETCRTAARSAQIVLHQAALGSVPRSIEDPIGTNGTNIDGFLNMLVASRDAGIQRFVYAASSSVYGDHPGLPKVEDRIGKPLSPYAVTKYVNELYADTFSRNFGLSVVGLRYFNVFGRRQDPDGAYSAVIPRWIAAMLRNTPVFINGDGETSRDFCYIDNAIQANLLAATTSNELAVNQIYNVAVGDRMTLNELFEICRHALLPGRPELENFKPSYRDFRAGDVRHSMADISKARTLLGYEPAYRAGEGLNECINWYIRSLA